MKTRLSILFSVILVLMLVVTGRASLEMPIWEAFSSFSDHPWAVATLWDAYFGFLTFYVWVAYREQRWTGKVSWFVLIALLGNIAMSAYVLLALRRLPEGATMDELLTGGRR